MNKIRAIFGLEPLPEEAEGEGEEEPVEEAEMNTGLQTALESPQDAEASETDAGSSSGAEQGLAEETEAAPGTIPARACLDAAANNSEEAEEPNPHPRFRRKNGRRASRYTSFSRTFSPSKWIFMRRGARLS